MKAFENRVGHRSETVKMMAGFSGRVPAKTITSEQVQAYHAWRKQNRKTLGWQLFGFRMGMRRPFLIGPSRQAGKALLLEDVGDGHRAEATALLLQEPADVVNGEVLFTRLDNLEAPGVGFRGAVGTFGRRQKERAVRVLAELAGQDAETARRIAESAGGLGRGELIDDGGGDLRFRRAIGRAKVLQQFTRHPGL